MICGKALNRTIAARTSGNWKYVHATRVSDAAWQTGDNGEPQRTWRHANGTDNVDAPRTKHVVVVHTDRDPVRHTGAHERQPQLLIPHHEQVAASTR